MAQFDLACKLVKAIRHFFAELQSLLRRDEDLRHQSYIIYGCPVDDTRRWEKNRIEEAEGVCDHATGMN